MVKREEFPAYTEMPDYKEVRRSMGGVYGGLFRAIKYLKDLIDNIEAGEPEDASITTVKLANGAVTAGKMAIFESTEQTGTGSAQNIAHGLGATPTIVYVVPTVVKSGADCSYEFTKGSTNVIVTATANSKFIVYAIA